MRTLSGADAFATCTVPNTLTNGQATDATQVMANFNSLLACINTTVTQVQTAPQGRLTLTSNTPVMTADATAQSTVYYTPYVGNQLPIAGAMYSFSQLSYSLSTSAHLAGNLYDVFAYYVSGAAALCTGPAWSSGTARAAALSLSNGIWSNQSSLTCTVSGGGSTTSLAANNATYLGTFYATANGQTGMAFKPTAASGGTNNVLGVYNGYNRLRIIAKSRDSSGFWTYSSTTWRSANNSTGNRVSFVDGLAQSSIAGTTQVLLQGTSAVPTIGMNLDSTSATPAQAATMAWLSSGVHDGNGIVSDNWSPVIGFHFIQAMESCQGGPCQFTAVGGAYPYQGLIVNLDM